MNPIPVIQNRRVVLGVTGSVAVYKAVDLASMLTRAGALVDVVMTGSATRFVSPLMFQSVTGRKVYGELWGGDAHIMHINLVHGADMLAIAPCTAHTLARLSHGLADDLLTVAALAVDCPLLIAPAMDAGMWDQSAIQENARVLRDRGAIIVGPTEGRLASGAEGIGRLVEPAEIMGNVRLVLGAHGSFAGRKCVVTAGGTQESIDPVRYISNHSSGKQGFALAQASLDRGAQVTLITAPTYLPTPVGASRVDVRSASEMSDAVLAASCESDVLIMAAAVSDLQSESESEHKMKLGGNSPISLTLEHTPDILESVADLRTSTGKPQIVVGFAAESQNLVENARSKLRKKQLALIAANDILANDAGFLVDNNRITLLDANEHVEELPLMTKSQVAEVICDRIEAMLN